LEITNSSADGVVFASPINVLDLQSDSHKLNAMTVSYMDWKLSNNEIITGDLKLDGSQIDLNGKTLTVEGNLIQSYGTMNVNGGTLVVKGDYRIQKATTTSGTTTYSYSGGILKMVNASDKVTVEGNFVTLSGTDHFTYLSAGVLEVKGDFTQLATDSYDVNYRGETSNFKTNGTHKVILSGTAKQTVSFDSPYIDNSHFTILEITNSSADGVVFATKIVVSTLFDHHRNKFTVSSSSDFPDYDGDGVKDNIDAYPTNPSLWNVVSLGDINGDGRIDMIDAIMALQIISGITPKNTVYKEADVNGDGKIGMQEVIYIIQKVAEIR
jgi:hypothetical protein